MPWRRQREPGHGGLSRRNSSGRGELGFAGLIKSAQTDEAIARMRVSELIEAVPGIGPVRAAAIMAEIGIAPSRRLRGLGIHQSRSLIDFMEDKYSV